VGRAVVNHVFVDRVLNLPNAHGVKARYGTPQRAARRFTSGVRSGSEGLGQTGTVI